MREGSRFGQVALLAAALAGSVACSTDTAGLARREPEGGAAGARDAAAPDGNAGSGGSAGSSAGGAPTSDDDPAGGSLEVVHGLVDGGSLFVCMRDALSGEPLASDAPEPGEGIPYARGWSLPLGWDVAAQDVELEFFVAVPDAIAEQSCSDLRARAGLADPLPAPTPDAGAPDAGPPVEPPFPLEPTPPRRAGSVRLAPGVVRAGAHYVLVAAGCTHPGGSSVDDVCGAEDELFGTRRALVLAEIAGELGSNDSAFGLQLLNASRALSRADLVLQWESQRESLRVSSDVGFGAVRPRDAARIDDEPVGLELHVRGESLSSFTQAWSDAVQASSAGVFARGGNYLAVYVGPLPGAVIPGVSPPRFVLVRGRAAPDGASLAQ